ncbi:MAG: tRNA (N(6)-L-threonylcarbamoyladenosine(37)-C(2))-methylthiotransferase MtaB [Rhodothermales bacterium]|nr:tRNA (N(6)-L-threonylcarbamoyladenosine(37)-C(2))-methylthiotransferase MtaB [Rhodothermales bacterium]
MSTVAFHTLGCKLNFAETGMIARQFEQRQFTIVPFGSQADVTVLNTCTVTDEADRKCRQMIRKAVRSSKDSFVIVTGCYAQLRPDEVADIPGVDAVLGTAEKHRLFDLLESFSRTEETQVRVSCIDDVTTFGPAYSAGERTRAFLKIQDGCDYTCSFCTIPMARGRSRSQTIADSLAQAREIASQGFVEIVLSGVNIGLYGNDTGTSLLDLLQELDGVDGVERYRISSIEPNLLTDRIIDFVAGSRRFVPHFHLPLQSGDDFVLGKMRRRYRRQVYLERVERIKQIMPDAGIGVDVIVGFPDETDERFRNTTEFIADLPVSYLHVFTYSERTGTTAVEEVDSGSASPIPRHERSRRNRVLRVLSEQKKHAFYKQHIGTRGDVLWESKVSDGYAFGFTDNYIRVRAPVEDVTVGVVENVGLAGIAEDGSVTVESTDPAFVSLT